jgi:hypothetical protein
MSRVLVKMLRDANNEKYVINVAVYSTTKRGLKASNDIDPGKCADEASLVRLVFTAGAACAEYLCEKFKERHDPQQCGALAATDLARECRLMATLTKGFGQKLAELLAMPLLPVERMRAERLQWSVNRGASPTQNEAAWVDRLIAAQSRRQRNLGGTTA